MIRAEEKAAEREQSRKAGDAGKAGKQEPLGRGSKKGGKAFLPSSRRARIRKHGQMQNARPRQS